jgi:hypothetical protein
MGVCLKCKHDPCQCSEDWPPRAPSNSSFFDEDPNKRKTLEECLSEEMVTHIDQIIQKGNQAPPAEIDTIEDYDGQEDAIPQDAPQAPFATIGRFGWIKGRFSWGIRVDFRPCSVGGMTDVFATNIIDIEDVGWRSCNNGSKWYKSIIRYRT